MAVGESYLNYVVEQLGRIRTVTWKRMFGGVGLYADGRFFGVIDNNILYFRTGDGNRAEYERRGMAAFQPMGPDTKPMAYHEVPGDVLEDVVLLGAWLAAAVIEAEKVARPKRAAAPKPARRKDRSRT